MPPYRLPLVITSISSSGTLTADPSGEVRLFAINHAATALLVKRQFPAAPMPWVLVSVQLMEFLWVVFNYVGLERTTTEPTVRSISDIHLAFIPYSHSLATGVSLAVLAWLAIAKGLRRPDVGLAIGIGVISHLVLDLITHAPDIQVAPGMAFPKLGLGLYSAAPIMAFIIEIAYGFICWWIYRGSKALLFVILLFNLGNLSMFSTAVPGPEHLLANRPMKIATVIAVQIAVTLTLVGILSRRPARP